MAISFGNIVPAYTHASPFSPRRWHPELEKYRAHEGVDIAAPAGSPIFAPPVDGVVVQNRYDDNPGGFGNYVVIRTMLGDMPIFTVYGHLKSPCTLQKNDPVPAGTKLGEVGYGGTGPHLHYEERVGSPGALDDWKNGAIAVDPMKNYFGYAYDLSGDPGISFGVGLAIPGQLSDPNIRYLQSEGDIQIVRYHPNGVIYVKDVQTSQEGWSQPTSTDGDAVTTKFSHGLITTVTYTPDGQIDTNVPGTVSLYDSASADVQAAFDAWVADGNDLLIGSKGNDIMVSGAYVLPGQFNN